MTLPKQIEEQTYYLSVNNFVSMPEQWPESDPDNNYSPQRDPQSIIRFSSGGTIKTHFSLLSWSNNNFRILISFSVIFGCHKYNNSQFFGATFKFRQGNMPQVCIACSYELIL